MSSRPVSLRPAASPDLGVALHGRGFPRRDVTENYAADYPQPVAGWFNIGVLHTACGRAGHENYAPCTETDLGARGYDYWALGHVHAFEIVSRDPWIVYPGNLQGRSVRECGEKGAVIVDVADGRVHAVRRVLTDRARWAEVVVDVEPYDDEPGVLRAIEAQVRPHVEASEGRMLAVRVTLIGSTPLHARLLADADLRDKTEAAAQRCGDDVWLERLRLATRAHRRAPARGPGGARPRSCASGQRGRSGQPRRNRSADRDRASAASGRAGRAQELQRSISNQFWPRRKR